MSLRRDTLEDRAIIVLSSRVLLPLKVLYGNMSSLNSRQAWIVSPLNLSQSRPCNHRSLCTRPTQRHPRLSKPVQTIIQATAQPQQETTPSEAPPSGGPPPTPTDPRGINGTTIFYFALLAAQLLPFSRATSGVAGDLIYFTVTALSCIVIGVRRAPLEPPAFSAAISSRQAIAAPFTASAFLFGSYLLLKYTSVDIGLVINALTTVGGAVCVKESLDPVFHSLLTLFNITDAELIPGGEVPPDKDKAIARPPLFLSNAAAALTAVATSTAYLLKIQPSFVFSNAIAVALATRVLSLIRPSSFVVAAGLLIGLFFYDIFWVFGSEVMVSVATQIDTPGKLLFPRDLAQTATNGIRYPYAILGLGDVCIPGIFISLAQSIDMKLASNLPQGKQPYFIAAVSSYIAALLLCFFVNFQTNAAQPALLYLVPSLIVSTLGVGAFRGELKDVISFSNDNKIENPGPSDVPKDGN